LLFPLASVRELHAHQRCRSQGAIKDGKPPPCVHLPVDTRDSEMSGILAQGLDAVDLTVVGGAFLACCLVVVGLELAGSGGDVRA